MAQHPGGLHGLVHAPGFCFREVRQAENNQSDYVSLLPCIDIPCRLLIVYVRLYTSMPLYVYIYTHSIQDSLYLIAFVYTHSMKTLDSIVKLTPSKLLMLIILPYFSIKTHVFGDPPSEPELPSDADSLIGLALQRRKPRPLPFSRAAVLHKDRAASWDPWDVDHALQQCSIR